MQELVPGVWHWTAYRETIRQDVHSYWAPAAGVVIDPMVPPGGIEAFAADPPSRVLLSNRHHYRQADAFVTAFGATVHCHEAGLHEFAGTDRVMQGFAFGDEVAPGVVAREVGALTPEETALHLLAPRALALADSLLELRGGLGFPPDGLLGDDPEAVRAGLRAAFRQLLELEWDALLLAHGTPVPTGGPAVLRRFAR